MSAASAPRLDNRALVYGRCERQDARDATVLPFFTSDTVKQLRGRGTKITYRVYKDVTHTTVVQAAGGATGRFLDRLFG